VDGLPVKFPISGAADIAKSELPEELYLGLMKKCLTRMVFPEKHILIEPPRSAPKRMAWRLLEKRLSSSGLELVRKAPSNPEAKEGGLYWPAEAETMIGIRRLNSLEHCVTDILQRRVPGDFIEAGVWRGGASIFMRAVLKAYGEKERIVWLADSFQGLPKPNIELYPADDGNILWQASNLAISVEEVKENFRRYDLLDRQVQFLEGWFRDTLPKAPIKSLSLLRLDGDMFESTIVALASLYPKLSPGGYAIVDDYLLPGCRAAVDEYRAKNHIDEPMTAIDKYATFWQRLA
jgi:O-methyltransferase